MDIWNIKSVHNTGWPQAGRQPEVVVSEANQQNKKYLT